MFRWQYSLGERMMLPPELTTSRGYAVYCMAAQRFLSPPGKIPFPLRVAIVAPACRPPDRNRTCTLGSVDRCSVH